MTTKPSLLYLTPVLPETGSSGGLILTLERLEVLSRHFDVTVLAIEASALAIARQTERFGLRAVLHAGRVIPRTVGGWIRSMASPYPFGVWRNRNVDFLRLATQLGEHTAFDVTYVDHWLMWSAAQCLKAPGRRVLHLHNAEHLIYARAAERARLPLRQVLGIEARRSGQYLRAICQEADEIHFISRTDADEVLKLGGITRPIEIFLPNVPLEAGEFGRFGHDLLFVGTMSWAPNAEGARWYQDEIVPRLPAGYQSHIAGGYVDGIKPVTRGPLIWHGRVPDLAPLYRQASVFVAPLLSGSGIKIKILNALGRGLPVVTTRLGAEGFPPGWGDAVSVADSPEKFVAAIERLCSDRALWQRASDAARPYLARHFSPQAFNQWTAQIARAPRSPSASRA
ncbi:MAG: glycosyltransferase family 4 protein [Roseateles sp.]|uniref:glycosyltransferase family 4 protein n=1 Tax=Roseateles sp. TaxID=1971397 RepID=UPI0039EC0F9F